MIKIMSALPCGPPIIARRVFRAEGARSIRAATGRSVEADIASIIFRLRVERSGIQAGDLLALERRRGVVTRVGVGLSCKFAYRSASRDVRVYEAKILDRCPRGKALRAEAGSVTFPRRIDCKRNPEEGYVAPDGA